MPTTRSMRGLLTVAALALAAFQGMAQRGREPVRIASDKQLFIDELLVGSRNNVELVMNPAQKTGERTIVPEHAWEDFWAGGWNTILEDEGSYKMWYDAASSEGAEKHFKATRADSSAMPPRAMQSVGRSRSSV